MEASSTSNSAGAGWRRPSVGAPIGLIAGPRQRQRGRRPPHGDQHREKPQQHDARAIVHEAPEKTATTSVALLPTPGETFRIRGRTAPGRRHAGSVSAVSRGAYVTLERAPGTASRTAAPHLRRDHPRPLSVDPSPRKASARSRRHSDDCPCVRPRRGDAGPHAGDGRDRRCARARGDGEARGRRLVPDDERGAPHRHRPAGGSRARARLRSRRQRPG